MPLSLRASFIMMKYVIKRKKAADFFMLLPVSARITLTGRHCHFRIGAGLTLLFITPPSLRHEICLGQIFRAHYDAR